MCCLVLDVANHICGLRCADTESSVTLLQENLLPVVRSTTSTNFLSGIELLLTEAGWAGEVEVHAHDLSRRLPSAEALGLIVSSSGLDPGLWDAEVLT